MMAWGLRRFACALAFTSATLSATASDAPATCDRDIAWQVLGSGGPELNQRAQSGHVLWIDGKARAIFDAGAGTAVAFGKAQGHFEDLDLIALSHLHTDHTADIPAYVKASFFSERRNDLPILGPPGNDAFPSLGAWLSALFSDDHAAYPYLAGFLQPDGAAYRLRPTTLQLSEGDIATVFTNPAFNVRATPVQHGPVPALAWRVDVRGRSVVYLGDTDAQASALLELAKHADLLIANLAISEHGDDDVASRLHAPPSRIAALAQRAGVRRLLLSHLMQRSEQALPESLRVIRSIYRGPVEVAHDGLCLPLPLRNDAM
ncbi:MBL fold metallo-hydrolase [Dyella koreensis]|uniref:MBL fold metallo-hydrolase n=1 Tax=Dyella koreensis TaxID=311235 RepID=A0ABW8K058_9GAMM